MKKILISTLAALVLTLASCDRFDKMSENPYALKTAPAQEYVHPIMFKTQYSAVTLFRNNTCLLMQYGVSRNFEASSKVVSNYNIPEGILDDAWTTYYIQYGNAMQMYEQAVKEKSKGLQAVALILRSMLMMGITDTYGDVPFFEAGRLNLSDGIGQYTTAYDSQKDIYREILAMLDDANTLLSEETDVAFNPVCDKTFKGNYEKWRRFGNSLYARALLRVGMKVIADDGGVIKFEDDTRNFSVADRLADLYTSFKSGAGQYPMMRSRDDRPMIHFDKENETEQTPFFGITSGVWNGTVVCDALTRRMLDGVEKIFELPDGTRPCGDQLIYVSDISATAHTPDPRFGCWWRKIMGMPTQMTSENVRNFYETYLSNSGNFKGGPMMRGEAGEPDPIGGHIYDLKNPDSYPMMQYSELCFLFAEAGARGWVAEISSLSSYKDLFKRGIVESILEWNPYVTEGSAEVTGYVNWVCDEELFSGASFGAANALEAILTEKWIASFFIGTESWAEYRRTGFPILKTNGPAAGNDYILPTRMRYPSDEAYRNAVTYQECLNRWLGGTNNMQTDVWWADTAESKTNREKGRQ